MQRRGGLASESPDSRVPGARLAEGHRKSGPLAHRLQQFCKVLKNTRPLTCKTPSETQNLSCVRKQNCIGFFGKKKKIARVILFRLLQQSGEWESVGWD